MKFSQIHLCTWIYWLLLSSKYTVIKTLRFELFGTVCPKVSTTRLAIGWRHLWNGTGGQWQIMSSIVSQITSVSIVYPTVCSGADQRKHQSSVSLAFVRGIHRWPVFPRTEGQQRGKYFHLMTSSCNVIIQIQIQKPCSKGMFCFFSIRFGVDGLLYGNQLWPLHTSLWHLISYVGDLFINSYNLKLTVWFPSQRASNAESVSMSGHRHGIAPHR